MQTPVYTVSITDHPEKQYLQRWAHVAALQRAADRAGLKVTVESCGPFPKDATLTAKPYLLVYAMQFEGETEPSIYQNFRAYKTAFTQATKGKIPFTASRVKMDVSAYA
jgi:hypothetical protein